MSSSCNAYAVIGLGFGDEGKGLTTNALSSLIAGSLVVRYSGGQQAGHTVTLKDGTSHVFSNFGSGSFNGTPTYWSKHCSFDPVGVVREFNILESKGITPTLHIDRSCPVTTPYEKYANIYCAETNYHGTCGVGVGATFKREEDFYSLLAGDLDYLFVVDQKLDLISNYHGVPFNEDAITDFYSAIKEIEKNPNIHIVDGLPPALNYVFEGSQGVLLDQHCGFFPHVTRSNTGTKNILEMALDPSLYLVTRAYQTRHGNGPMSNEEIPHNIIDNPKETNITHEFQGEFRKSILDLSLLKYGAMRDDGIRRSRNKTLVITCCDLIDGDYHYTINGVLKSEDTKEDFGGVVARYLGIDDFLLVDSPSAVNFV